MLDATREGNSLSDPNHLMLQADWMRANPTIIDNPVSPALSHVVLRSHGIFGQDPD
jgi:hypothetical protein